MEMNILPNGNLEIKLEEADREELTEMVEKYPDDRRFLDELLEYTGWRGNAMLFALNPGDIAALTDAPIVCDDVEIDDDGKAIVHGKVWWYPGYDRKHFGEELLANGRTVFTFAPTETAS